MEVFYGNGEVMMMGHWGSSFLLWQKSIYLEMISIYRDFYKGSH